MRSLIFLPILLIFNIAHSSEFSGELEAIRAKYGLPGLAAAYYKDGILQAKAAVGVRKIGEQAKLGDHDRFHLGSCSKAMTATLAAILIEEDKLSWETPLKKFFPRLKLDEAFQDMPFEKLLSHSAGLQANKEGLARNIFTDQNTTTMEKRKILASRVLTRVPQKTPDKYSYSNMGYMIAGHILEKVSKKDYRNLMQEKVFSPLGMKSCGFGPLSGVEDPSAHFYENGVFTPVDYDNPKVYDPAGRIHCSLEDWGKFLNEQLKAYRGESSLLSKKALENMHSNSVIVYEDKKNNKNNIYYTTGGWTKLSRSWAGDYALTHSGTNLLNYARVWMAPSKGIVLIATSNAAGEIKVSNRKEYLADKATNEAVVAIKAHVDGN